MSRHHRGSDGSRLHGLVAAVLIGISAVPAQAETGSANAADVSVHISLLGVAELNVDPQAPVGFENSTAPTYQQDSLASIDYGNGLVQVSSGTVSTAAQYVPGVSFSGAEADVDIEKLQIGAASLLGDPLLSIAADSISTHSDVTGYCMPGAQRRTRLDEIMFSNGFDTGNLTPGGLSTGGGNGVSLHGINISILGIPITNLPDDPAPNTTVDLGALGIADATLTLNEQTIGGDGTSTSSLSRNAIHLTMDNAAGLVTADVTLGHSDSKLDCTQ